MKSIINRSDELSRRGFLSQTAGGLLGVSLMPSLAPTSLFAQTRNPSAKANKVIYLYMSGGMSHMDTFDPKPGADEQGPVQAIDTNVDGIKISEYLPSLARQMDKMALVRSLSSTQGAHEQGQYFMHSSYTPRGTIQHPGLGAWMHRLDGRKNSTLPASVRIGGSSRGSGSGFLESKFAPLVINNPNDGLKNSKRRQGMSEKEFKDRLDLASAFDEEFHRRYNHKKVRAYTDMYEDAIRLMKSEDLKAFDLNKESKDVRDEYGDNSFGQGCLLARRLIENDVRFVEVSLGGWDTHNNNFDSVSRRAGVLDQAMATLISDLERRGLLEETLVVLATEFGRTPRINENDGRDHFPKAFSGVLAGGGIKGGQAYGVTDETSSNVLDQRVSVPDFNATIAHALGLPLDEVVYSPSKRPFTVAHKGRPVIDLLA
ncbi:MAG: DUF1501 domain-containing protein [Verrucomicrobiales bacterium]|jgi:hypothetical protein|nr:DUF1501 domain-containing protein [Verrucomicrobiales bacterium]MDF1785857.1 DUF1501 domain-containing protein [Verrucomicrobiales bacterium]